MDILTVANKDLTVDEFSHLHEELKGINRLGLSTYSKLLYFSGVKVNGNPCLILDLRLIEVFKECMFEDFSSLADIRYANASKHYLKYLNLMQKMADELGTEGEKVEEFLFLFGGSLK